MKKKESLLLDNDPESSQRDKTASVQSDDTVMENKDSVLLYLGHQHYPKVKRVMFKPENERRENPEPFHKKKMSNDMMEPESENTMRGNPSGTLLVTIVVSMFLVALQTAASFFSFFPRLSFGFFTNGVVKVYNIFPVAISPSKLFYSMMPMCQVGQVGILIYTVVSLFRRTALGPQLSNPSILTTMFFFLWNIYTALNIVWNFVFDKVFFPESGVLLALSISTLVPAYGIASARLAFFQPQLVAEKRRFDQVSLRSGVLNVLAMQITQAIISLVIDVTIISSAAFTRPAIQELISSVSLSILGVLTLGFTALDVSWLEPYSRSVLAPYVSMAMSALSMIQSNWTVDKPSSLLKLALLTSSLTGLLVKLAVSVYNRDKRFHSAACGQIMDNDDDDDDDNDNNYDDYSGGGGKRGEQKIN